MKFLRPLLILLMLTACRADPPTPPYSNLPLDPPTATFPAPAPALPSTTPLPITAPEARLFTVGYSVEGREIMAHQFGDGPHTLVLIGGIHGGYEYNTVMLAEQLIAHFETTPGDALMRIIIIPNANPDGAQSGRGVAARFNANGVDLNRNWGCGWEETAYLGPFEVDPGTRAFSEPESVALRDFFTAYPPDAVIFYHSALGEIFLGACQGSPPPVWLGEALQAGTGYTYQPSFDYYPITGDATNWLAAQGIPAAVVELLTRTEPEFDRNLRGVMRVQCHITQVCGAITTP